MTVLFLFSLMFYYFINYLLKKVMKWKGNKLGVHVVTWRKGGVEEDTWRERVDSSLFFGVGVTRNQSKLLILYLNNYREKC